MRPGAHPAFRGRAMPIDWFKSHPGFTVFAALWIVALALKQVVKKRDAGFGFTLAKWIVVFLTLAAGAVLLSRVQSALPSLMGYLVISGLLAAMELGMSAF